MDDGSIDGTLQIIKSAQKKCEWIKLKRLPQHDRDIGKHYAFVCKSGFDYAIKNSSEKSLNYNFIGLVDADMFLEESFFEKLIKQGKLFEYKHKGRHITINTEEEKKEAEERIDEVFTY